jgi:flagellar biosynthesis/type III secretory pathway chaperone
MNQELTASFDLVERRLALMRELAASLEQVQSAVVHSDLRGIDSLTAQQGEICEGLRRLEGEASQNPPGAAIARQCREQESGVGFEEGSFSLRQRSNVLAQELNEVELRVAQLNRVYGALLRRTQRTLQIFLRVLESSANTYVPPRCASPVAESTLQEVSHV